MQDACAGERRRDAIREAMAALLARYPELSAEESETLIAWFRRGASSLDEALLSAGDDTREGYRRFKADHADRIRPKSRDWITVAAFVSFLLLAVALLWDYGL